jgi:uncharacterized membrane protein YphA (DoxX/SURF4 family)
MTTISFIQPLQIKRRITFLLCLLFGLMFINAGLNKFFNYMPVRDHMPEKMIKMGAALMEIGWVFPLVGIVEILGGLLFIMPKFRALGAIMLFPVMIGILLTHLTAAPAGLPMACILLTIHLWIIIENRAKYLRMIH